MLMRVIFVRGDCIVSFILFRVFLNFYMNSITFIIKEKLRIQNFILRAIKLRLCSPVNKGIIEI